MIGVSVLIPAFNEERILSRAIRSALDQADINVQVIVCDNGSSDDTYKEASRFPTVDVFRVEDNVGWVNAINMCGDRAQGRTMIPLGADDWFEANALTKLYGALVEHPDVDFAYGQMRYWGRRSDTYTPPAFDVEDFYERNVSNYPVMFRREVWERGLRYGAEIETSVGAPDWDWVLQMIESGSRGLAMEDVLVLNWIFAFGRNTDKTWEKHAIALAELKRRHPKVRATRI